MDFFCDACEKLIETDANRFHCHKCENFDLCEKCYDLKTCVNSHDFNHRIQKIISPSSLLPEFVNNLDNTNKTTKYFCDGCKESICDDSPRYHCITCNDYDLCEKCENDKTRNNENPHSNIHCMCYYRKSSYNKKQKEDLDNGDDNNKICLICREKCENSVSCKTCQKCFCMEHILKWMCKSNGTCPNCRKHFDFTCSDDYNPDALPPHINIPPHPPFHFPHPPLHFPHPPHHILPIPTIK
jgi:hypothetical protein